MNTEGRSIEPDVPPEAPEVDEADLAQQEVGLHELEREQHEVDVPEDLKADAEHEAVEVEEGREHLPPPEPEEEHGPTEAGPQND